VGEEEDRIQQ
jgi:hypothetical protein